MRGSHFRALVLCFVFSTGSIYAQTNTPDNDTILMLIRDRVKVMFIGNDLSEMADFKKVDSLKVLFINDLEEARKQSSYPMDSRTTHYFVHPNGKRRLKAENEDYSESDIDLTAEKSSLGLDLPPYLYIIHDFSSNYELRIYLEHPEELSRVFNCTLWISSPILQPRACIDAQ